MALMTRLCVNADDSICKPHGATNDSFQCSSRGGYVREPPSIHFNRLPCRRQGGPGAGIKRVNVPVDGKTALLKGQGRR
jgi:hypothetical protein